MKGNSRFISVIKRIIFACIPLIFLLIISELGLRAVYFQVKGRHKLVLISTYERVRKIFLAKSAARQVKNLDIPKNLNDALYSNKGRELLEEFRKIYEDNFKILIKEADKIQSKLLILYIPLEKYMDLKNREKSRGFYSKLAKKYNLDFIDLTQEFSKYPVNTITLLPENGHLSRFGNKVVAQKVSEYLDKYENYQMTFKFQNRPKRFGDLKPDDKSIWEIMPSIPYKVITNKQGLRMDYDITFPKKKQRILILGDSLAFGPYLPGFHVFPGLLDKKYPDREVINAGFAGYTIIDEVALFVERAKYAEPDIIVLQVTDNDIPALFFFMKNKLGRRGGKVYAPSKLEKEFLSNIKEKNN